MMEVPVPKKKEKKVEKEKEEVVIKKEEKIEPKKESLAARILDILFGYPKYDPEIHDIAFKLGNFF